MLSRLARGITTKPSSINRSINQSVNRAIIQPISQSITQSINQPIQFKRILPCSSFHSLAQSIKSSSHQSVNQSLNQSTTQSLNVTVNRSLNQSTIRSILTGPPVDENAGFFAKLSAQYTEWKPRIITYLYLGAVVVVGVFILRGGLYFVNFFTSLDFADVGRWAFFAGMATSFSLVGLLLIGRRMISLRPESVYQDAMKQVLNDITVRSFLGNQIKTGSFRAYSFVPGTVRLPGTVASQPDAADEVMAANPTFFDRLMQYWKPRRLQLFFQITGSDGNHAMCSAEVQKVRGSMRYNLLCVDILNTGQRVVLMGSPDYQIYQGVIKLR